MLLDADDIGSALSELATRLAEEGVAARVRIVGGAALSISHLERAATADVDALFAPVEPVRRAAAQIARERGWSLDWLNNEVRMFQSHFDDQAAWKVVVTEGDVTISVAPADLLLAMKLYAGRGRRDGDDIAGLLEVCRVGSLAEAEEIFERYYPREEIAHRARRQLVAVLGD